MQYMISNFNAIERFLITRPIHFLTLIVSEHLSIIYTDSWQLYVTDFYVAERCRMFVNVLNIEEECRIISKGL
jgi:hypothetical protein